MRSLGVTALGTLIAATVALAHGQAPQAQQPPTVVSTGFIAGQVLEVGTSRPVPNATVQIFGRGSLAGRAGGLAVPQPNGSVVIFRGAPNVPVIADSQGRFFFGGLAAGSYFVRATKTGYGATGPLRTIDLADKEQIVDAKVRLWKLGVISGTLRDEAGDPVVGTTVWAMRRTVDGGHVNFVVAGAAKSDDRGAYRLDDLSSGDYYICACARDPIPFDGQLLTTLAAEPSMLMSLIGRAVVVGADAASLDNTLRTFAPTFYPSSATMAQATRVTLASGDERSGMDFTLTPTRATRVSGRVVGATGPVVASSIGLALAGESSSAGLRPVLVQPDGRFDFASVPPGQYVLRVNHVVRAPGAQGPTGSALQFLGDRANAMGAQTNTVDEPMQWAEQPVTVGEDGVKDLIVPLRTSVKVSGRVSFAGATPPSQQALRSVSLSLLPLGPDLTRNNISMFARANRDGTFEIHGVPPDRYGLNYTNVPGFPTLRSITLGGLDVTDLPFEIGTSDAADLVLTFSDSPQSSLGGTATGVTPADELTALIFPTDRRYWTDPIASRRRYGNAPVGKGGAFGPLPVSPGEYFIVLAPDRDVANWQDATKLEAWSAKAQRVSLAIGESKTIEVRR